jgi:hypothetical protein
MACALTERLVAPFKYGHEKGIEVYKEAYRGKKFTTDDIRIRDLAETVYGESWSHKMRESQYRLQLAGESVDAITPDIFSAVAGQMIQDRVEEAYKIETELGEQLVDVTKNPGVNLGVHRRIVPGSITQMPTQVKPAQEYPVTGLSTNYTDIPTPTKQGLVVFIAEETVYADDTAFILEQSDDVGEYLGNWVDESRINLVLGLNGNWNFNGTTYNTYITSGSSAYQNANDAFTLVDVTSLNSLELLFTNFVHPNTGKPLSSNQPTAILMGNTNKLTMRSILSTGYELRQVNSNTTRIMTGSNPLDTMYPILSSNKVEFLLKAAGLNATQAASTIVLANFKKAFGWREVYPLETYRANASATDLTPSGPLGMRDIVYAMKARVYGVPYVKEPRYTVRGRNMA